MALVSVEFFVALVFSSKVGWLLEGAFSTLPFMIVGYGMYSKGKQMPCPFCGVHSASVQKESDEPASEE